MSFFDSKEGPKEKLNGTIHAGACDFCGTRYRGVEKKDGKIICPTCQTPQEKK